MIVICGIVRKSGEFLASEEEDVVLEIEGALRMLSRGFV